MKGKEEEMDYTPVETISLAPNIILESIRDPHRRHCNDVWLVGRGKRLFVETIHGAIKRKNDHTGKEHHSRRNVRKNKFLSK